ncbi:MAG: glycoside hydrolase, partial [Prevotella sp.]|nr:glycoside hydrolase [Prevotella sp.]
VHLQPVDWSSGWPIMGKKGEPVTTYKKPKSNSSVIVNPVESDEFNSFVLGKQWQWQANYDQTFGMPTAFGKMRVYTYKMDEDAVSLWNVPNMLLQKTPADSFTATAKLRMTSKEDNQMGGIIMMGLDYSAIVVKRIGDEFKLLRLTCQAADKGKTQQEELIATLKPTERDKVDYQPAIHEDIYLRMVVGDSHCRFYYSSNGKTFKEAGSQFKMKEGKWIGAKIGLIAVEPAGKTNRGWIEADWFRITK